MTKLWDGFPMAKLGALGGYRQTETSGAATQLPSTRFRAAVQAANIEREHDIPHVSAALIKKYLSDLHELKIL